jgi:hypothetical protein
MNWKRLSQTTGAVSLEMSLGFVMTTVSTAGCSSKNQGIDAAEGQGHLCEKAAGRISKAFLMSIYNAGK